MEIVHQMGFVSANLGFSLQTVHHSISCQHQLQLQQPLLSLPRHRQLPQQLQLQQPLPSLARQRQLQLRQQQPLLKIPRQRQRQ